MAGIGTTYNPSAVMMGRPQATMMPYLDAGAKGPKPIGPEPFKPRPPQSPALPTATVGPSSVRATGSGPFDQAYRQNLASYAGGQFARPSSGMSFNPTDPNTFPGQPTGGGNAPVTGMPNTLLDQALGGQSFSWTPPPAQPSSTPSGQATMPSLQDWLKQFLMNTRLGVQAY